MLLSVMITPVIIRLGRRFNVVDLPSIRKVHCRPIPRIGGVAVFVPMMCMTISVLFLRNLADGSFSETKPKITALLLAATFIFFVGLTDDIKGIRARTKLLCQVAAAIIVYVFGIRITYITVSNWLTLNLGWFSLPLTILWIVGITNAVNLIDGMDGLAAGISAVACSMMVVLSIHFCQPVMAVIMLSLLGALCGFLLFNFNPAKTFMGDCGSLFIGFTLASASVMCTAKSNAFVSLTLPILVLGIPIFDTLFSILRRFLSRRSIFSPDLDHFHHRLLALGLGQRQVVIIAYAVTLLAGGLGMFMIITRDSGTIMIFVCVLLLLVIVFRVIGAVRLHETIERLRERCAIISRIKQETENFEKVELYFQQAKTFEQWWQSVCFAADKMDLVKGSLPLTNRDGTKRTLSWEKAVEDKKEERELVRITVPIRDRRAGLPLRLELDVRLNGSIESVGRRIAFFGRLVEEYAIAHLPDNVQKTFPASSFEEQSEPLQLQAERR